VKLLSAVAALLLVTSGVAQAAPVCDEHVLGTALHYEVGGTTLRVYGSDGSVAVEDNRVPRTLRFGTAVSTSTFVSGASRAGSRFLFDGLDLDVDNADGTRTLTLGIGSAQATWVAPLHLTVHATVVSATRGGQFGPLQAPDGSIADGFQLSADGVALVHTFAGYWLLKHGQFTSLPDAWFTGVDFGSGVLAPGGRSFAFGVSAPSPTVPTQVVTVDLSAGARRTYSLLDATLPSVAGLAYSVRHPGRLYLLRHSHPISIHQPVTTQLQSLDLGSGVATAIGSAIPEYAPRLFPADVA
jgi:hypothetical protein